MKKKALLIAFIFCLFTPAVFSQTLFNLSKSHKVDSLYLEMERKLQDNVGKQFPKFGAETLNGESVTENNLK